MKGVNASIGGVLDKLVECTARGVQVELMLRDGHQIRAFRVHEVIAPKGGLLAPGGARARGIVWPEHGTRRDEYVQVRDIQSVRAERGDSILRIGGIFREAPASPELGAVGQMSGRSERVEIRGLAARLARALRTFGLVPAQKPRFAAHNPPGAEEGRDGRRRNGRK